MLCKKRHVINKIKEELSSKGYSLGSLYKLYPTSDARIQFLLEHFENEKCAKCFNDRYTKLLLENRKTSLKEWAKNPPKKRQKWLESQAYKDIIYRIDTVSNIDDMNDEFIHDLLRMKNVLFELYEALYKWAKRSGVDNWLESQAYKDIIKTINSCNLWFLRNDEEALKQFAKEISKNKKDWHTKYYKDKYANYSRVHHNKRLTDNDILNCSASATLKEIRRAYLRLCKRYHPDINPDGAEKMKEINSAYERLLKTVKK